MRSFTRIAKQAKGKPLLADDVLEFHAARLLLLVNAARNGKIDGLTKLAKLDFFVRYPAFFNELSRVMGGELRSATKDSESNMIRFRYGPWDPRYYQIIPFLEARQLIEVEQDGRSIRFQITDRGRSLATSLRSHIAYAPLQSQIEAVTTALGRSTGNQLKELIYQLFQTEVANRKMGERIE